jgi:peptidoglycan/xylan/chitin deacetylase (PgdA/CDA1 family)
VCYVVHVHGLSLVNTAIRQVLGDRAAEVNSLAEIFDVLFPSLSLLSRQDFLETLLKLADIDERSMAREASLYLTTEQLRGLQSYNFEIGNHTYTHMHCRSLTPEDVVTEIDLNKSELEAKSGTKVRSFSVPYGSSKDLSEDLIGHLRRTGHETVFLSESVANSPSPNRFRLDRIGSQAKGDGALFVEIELMPRLRAVRNQLFPAAT